MHEALRLNSQYAKAWIALGDTLHPGETIGLGGNFLVSKEYLYRKAIKCDPESDEGYKKLGKVRTQEP